MISRELLEKGEKALERELEKLFSKSELTATDWDAVKKAMTIHGMLMCCEKDEPYDENGMSRGIHYDRDYDIDGYSGMRGRSPVTGRYVSRGEMGGYSGHSIEDRMIMALEQQMDGAKTDYERSQIEKEIRRIRRGE